jgi:hypothetical protein
VLGTLAFYPNNINFADLKKKKKILRFMFEND